MYIGYSAFDDCVYAISMTLSSTVSDSIALHSVNLLYYLSTYILYCIIFKYLES